MARETKQKNLYYKKVKFSNGANNLQQLLKQGLIKRKKVGERSEKLGDEDLNGFRFINSHRNQQGMLFGNFIFYEPGLNRLLLTVDLDKDELSVEQIAPPKQKDGKRQEFLDSILYFGIQDNHLVLLQSPSLKARDFQNYLNWFLSEHKIISEDEQLIFADEPKPATKSALKKFPVRSIHIGFDVFQDGDPKEKPQVTQKTKKIAQLNKETGIRVLREILGNKLDKYKELREALKEPDLRVGIEVKYSKRTKKDEGEFLNEIATSFSNLPAEDFKVNLKGGGELKGSEFKLYSSVSIRVLGGHVDQSDLFPKMQAWLLEKLELGYILP